MRMKGLAGTTLSLKVRFDDRSVRSVQASLAAPSNDDIAMRPELMRLLDKVWKPGQKVRLLGVAVSHFDGELPGQQMLFEDSDTLSEDDPAGSSDHLLVEDAEKRRRLLAAFDTLKDKFGEDTVRFASELGSEENTTGSSSKNPADYS